MIALDSDILAIFHIFNKDPRFEATKQLLHSIKDQTKAVTIFVIVHQVTQQGNKEPYPSCRKSFIRHPVALKNHKELDSGSTDYRNDKLLCRCNVAAERLPIFNLFELCGIISTSTGKEDAAEIYHKYISSKDATIIIPNTSARDMDDLWASLVSECFSIIQRRLRLGDAVILWTLETNDNIDSFITWNTKHFKCKTSIKILTPSEFLKT